MGNPSDGFGGKTVSLSIANYFAEVQVCELAHGVVRLQPHPVFDPLAYQSLDALRRRGLKEGYVFVCLCCVLFSCLFVVSLLLFNCRCSFRFGSFDGGLRLLRAMYRSRVWRKQRVSICHVASACYNTTVPVQVGLAGSSAIITAVFRALAAFYGVTLEQLAPLAVLPSHVLSVERDMLGIAAGLQDRVIQVLNFSSWSFFSSFFCLDLFSFSRYGACPHFVCLSFRVTRSMRALFTWISLEHFATHGHGHYVQLNPQLLPPLYLAFISEPSFSGKVHSPSVLVSIAESRLLSKRCSSSHAMPNAPMNCSLGSIVGCHVSVTGACC